MFIAASQHIISTDRHEMINRWLDININMQYIREHARLSDKLLYLQLQQSLWTNYFDIGTKENVWASEVQEKISRQKITMMMINDASHTMDDPLSFFNNFRKNIDEQLQETENELNKLSTNFTNNTRQKLPFKNIADLSAILKAFVRKGQHKLNAEFQCKKRLHHFDCRGHQLTKDFFDLQPTKKQIRAARKIWTAIFKQQLAEEQVAMLKHRLFCKVLPSSFNNILDRPSNDLNESLRAKVIDKDTRKILTSLHNKIIGQVKLDMMTIHISTAEATARGHAKIAREEKDKFLSKINTDNADEINMANNLMNAIQAREENIIKRAQYVTNCKVSFFGETPATLLIEETATSSE